MHAKQDWKSAEEPWLMNVAVSMNQPSKAEVCVDEQFLGTVDELSLWAEGIEGVFQLELESVAAHIPGEGFVQV